MTYTHIENKNKPFVDWRLPEKRIDGFLLWLKWRMRHKDLDHYACNNAYRDADLKKSPTGSKMTREQSLWFSIIFGMTYQSEMSWVIYWNFPNLFDIDYGELETWNVSNLNRQLYAKDTKYNKGRIVEQVKSIRSVVEPFGSLENFFDSKMENDEQKSFENIYNAVQSFHKFGRMTTWICLQVLFETAGLKIRPNTVMATDPSSWSVRSGLMYVFNKDEKIEATNENVKFSKEELEWIKEREVELYDLSYNFIDEKDRNIFSNYLLESHLCQYKKLMLGGDYPGHSSGDHVSRALTLQENWPEVNFAAFFEDAMQNHHPLVRGKKECKPLRDLCMATGQMINMHDDFDFMPNLYLEYGFDQTKLNDDSYVLELKKRIESFGVKKESPFEAFFC
jgi:hypothetical protein